MALKVANSAVVQRDITIAFANQRRRATPFYPAICTRIPSSSLDEKYGWLGDLPGMREWIGPREFLQLREAEFVLKNKDWESSLDVSKNAVNDDRLGTLLLQINGLADEATYHPDELLFENVVNLGESQACYDGQFFFDTDHVWGDSGTQSNDIGATAVAATAPTSAEFKTAFHAALIQLLGFKNDRGKPYIRPKVGVLGDLICAVPLSMYEAATKAFNQPIVLDGGAGVSNFSIEIPNVTVIQYMGAGFTNGSDAKWDLYHTGGPLKPYVFQDRAPLEFQMKGMNDIEFKDAKAMTAARYNIGYLAWFKAVRTTFS